MAPSRSRALQRPFAFAGALVRASARASAELVASTTRTVEKATAPLARGIAEVHGGRLWAESPGEGRGATFYFLLPTGAPNGVPMSVVMGSSAGRTVPLTR